jgi:hypothetical protein
MKFSSKLAISGVVAGLSAAQVAVACSPPQIEIADAPAPEVCTFPEAPVIVDASEEVIDETVIDEQPTDDQPTDEEVSPDDEVVIEDGGEVPIDWVKRGGEGENPDVIFYNMAGGGEQPTGPATSPVAKDDAGKDGAATTVEAKTVTPAAPLEKVKKGPVALVKGARVFLRH